MVEVNEDPVAKQAIAWIVLVKSGTASAEELQSFTRWRQEDPRHEAACGKLERMLGGLANSGVETSAVRQAMAVRRRAVRSLFGLGVIGILGSATYGLWPGAGGGALVAYTAPRGRREKEVLGDGSLLTLNANSQVQANAEGLSLTRGEVFIDRAQSSPFTISTAAGIVVATNAALACRYRGSECRVAVTRGSAILKRSGEQAALGASGVATITSSGITRLPQKSADAETAWLDGMLQVSDAPLTEVIADLQDYSDLELVVDKRVADRRIAGVFRLDDPDKALRSLTNTFRLTIRTLPGRRAVIESA